MCSPGAAGPPSCSACFEGPPPGAVAKSARLQAEASALLGVVLLITGTCRGLATNMQLPFPAHPVPRVAMNDPEAFEYIKREEPVILTVRSEGRDAQ